MHASIKRERERRGLRFGIRARNLPKYCHGRVFPDPGITARAESARLSHFCDYSLLSISRTWPVGKPRLVSDGMESSPEVPEVPLGGRLHTRLRARPQSSVSGPCACIYLPNEGTVELFLWGFFFFLFVIP